MTEKQYYMTTVGHWQRHAGRFATSHFIVLEPQTKVDASQVEADVDARILVLIEADEGVHVALEDDVAFEALQHPLAQKAISEGAQAALTGHGVAPGATTFEVAEAVARVHPLLRHRVF